MAETEPDALLRELYERSWVPLVRLAALMLGSTDSAEEVVQDAFVAIFARADRFPTADTAAGYLRTSVVNGCRSVHRHRAVVQRKPMPLPAAPDGPDESAVREVDRRRLLDALHQLPERQREVLVLRYYDDASEADIAQTLGISRGAVKSHAHRGMSALRQQLHHQRDDSQHTHEGGRHD